MNVIIELDLFLLEIYALYLYYLGLSLRYTSKVLEPLVDRSYVATIWYWIQEFDPKMYTKTKGRRLE